MANIVVTKIGSGVYVDFGIYANEPYNQHSPLGFNKRMIESAQADGTAVMLKVTGRDGGNWTLTSAPIADPRYLVVDSIEGQTISDDIDLIQKLTALM